MIGALYFEFCPLSLWGVGWALSYLILNRFFFILVLLFLIFIMLKYVILSWSWKVEVGGFECCVLCFERANICRPNVTLPRVDRHSREESKRRVTNEAKVNSFAEVR